MKWILKKKKIEIVIFCFLLFIPEQRLEGIDQRAETSSTLHIKFL